MDVQTDERLLINVESYLIELPCNAQSMDEVNLVAGLLVSVQDALRHVVQEPICPVGSNRETLVLAKLADSITEISTSGEEGNYSWFVDRVRWKT